VHLDRAQEDEAAGEPARGFREADRCVDVDAPDLGFLRGAVCDRREVHDHVDALEQRSPVEFRGEVRDKDPVYLGGTRGSGHAAYRRAHGMSAREQFSAKCGADETRCTRDKNAHVEPLEGAVDRRREDSSKPLSAAIPYYYNTRFIRAQGVQ
jgi:hypothetical protein